jgi:pimeloyl-ACP methyl ester carboxylesterase
MGFWLGRSQWMFAPRRFRTRAMRTMPKVAAEFQLLSESRAALSEHSGIDCPVTLIEGSRSPLVARAVVRALASTLPDVRVVELEGAGHMSPFTHPERVRALVIAHLARAPAPRNVLPVAAQERLSA